jgi:hypothetical protein
MYRETNCILTLHNVGKADKLKYLNYCRAQQNRNCLSRIVRKLKDFLEKDHNLINPKHH